MELTPDARRALLTECFDLKERWRKHEMALDADRAEGRRITTRLSEIYEQYRAALPLVALSRCPFCQAALIRSFDPVGLDGLWWDHALPIRRLEESHCAHFVGLSGAVHLDRTHLEVSPILVIPGPEAPFVVPRLLGQTPVRAVVSSLPVGAHTAYPVAYFADPIAQDLARVNTWGTEGYQFVRPAGSLGWSQAFDDDESLDFELTGWLDRDKLAYIAPGDGALTLVHGSAGCPYVGLAGRRQTLHLQRGRVWGDASELRAG